MDVLSLSKIRVQVLQQVFPSGEEPIDIPVGGINLS